jgi:hypothetical protein
METDIQNALESSIIEALKYRNSTYLFYKDNDSYKKKYFLAWDNYNMSVSEKELYNLFSIKFSKILKPNILDVGSGKHMTATALIEYCDINKYLSIDKSLESINYNNITHKINNWIHYDFDIFENKIKDNDLYDIVLIDIEPHGCEIEVYEKVKHLLKDVHLVILKHVAYITGSAGQCADKFIDKYKNNVYDFYGEYVTKAIRDVFIIMSKENNPKTKSLQDLVIGKPLTYTNSDLPSYIKYS